MRTSALPVCLARWRVKRVYRACVLACQPCAGERRRASAIAMSGSSRGTTTNCCRAPTCHTNDACGRPEQAPQQTGGRSSSSAARSAARRSSAAQQRGAALQQSEAQSRTSAFVCCCLDFDSQVLMILKFRVHARQQTRQWCHQWHEAVADGNLSGGGAASATPYAESRLTRSPSVHTRSPTPSLSV